MILTSNYKLVVGEWLLPIVEAMIARYTELFFAAVHEAERESLRGLWFWSHRN